LKTALLRLLLNLWSRKFSNRIDFPLTLTYHDWSRWDYIL